MMLLLLTWFPLSTIADWDPEDGYKMHFPQLPDPNGWDVNAQNELADDWQCSETGYVKDIHFWGSWEDDIIGTINSFNIAIYANNPGPPSTPHVLLWEREIFNGEWIERGPYDGDQGFYWPEDNYYDWNNHDEYYQYNIFLDGPWFLQEEGNIYWLAITANVQSGTWGWKSSNNHWNDDAVWRAPTGQWMELYEPEPPITNQFWITMMGGQLVDGGGTDYFEDGNSFLGWYYYQYLYPDIWWWNIWFYDHPFNHEKYKDIYVSFWCDPIEPVWFVVNFATDIWFYEGAPGRPPLPQDVPNPQIEDIYIGRLPSPYEPIMVSPGFNEFEFTIPDYNPEWVSIDFMGTDFIITDGIIIHHCLPPDTAGSLDLAFVITGDEEPLNNPPNTPTKPSGPTSGVVGIYYTYNTSTTDPDGDQVKYGWDSNSDDIVDYWSPFYLSGATHSVNIRFGTPGTYTLRVKAEDIHGAQSGFSSTLNVVISGANNAPNAPNTPSGPSSGYTGMSYNYSTSTTDPDGDDVKYGWDFDGDGTVDKWTGYSYSGATNSTSHNWSSAGTYNIKVKAEDSKGAQSDFSTVKTVIIADNTPPTTPAISGPTSGKAGTSHTYSATSTDPEGHHIFYWFDWGDGTNTGWLGPYFSGQTANTAYIWSSKGTYTIEVKAKDDPNGDGDCSDGLESGLGTLTVEMPKTKLYLNLAFQRFFENHPHFFPLLRKIMGF